MSKSAAPEYKIWHTMRDRCTIPSRRDYLRYGGRGVRVCEEWMNSYEAFISYVGPRPTPQHSIDRYPDNDGNYEPGNVRWATLLEQANNKRTNRVVVYRGKEMSVADAARAGGKGVTRETAICRLRSGWTIERAVETAPLFRRKPDGRIDRQHAE